MTDRTTSVLVHEGYLNQLGGIEVQLVCLRALMDETKDTDKYSAVLGLLEPIIDEFQQVTGRIWRCKRQPRATVSELRPVPDEGALKGE